jgi:predicted amidohydrolase
MNRTIALFQGPETAGGPEANLARLERLATDAAARGAELLICCEMFLTGYNIGAETVARLAEPTDGRSAQQAAAIARAVGIALLYGYPERGADGAVYNAALLLDRRGRRRLNYRKSHLFGEIDRGAFAAGPGGAATADLDGLSLGVLICYDVEFPENVRLLALAGADLVAVPTALMHPYEVVARSVVTARAYENQVFVAYANRCGREGSLEYCGLSSVAAPDGTDLARAGLAEEMIIGELDFDRLTASRRINTHLADRRPELYAPLVERSRG